MGVDLSRLQEGDWVKYRDDNKWHKVSYVESLADDDEEEKYVVSTDEEDGECSTFLRDGKFTNGLSRESYMDIVAAKYQGPERSEGNEDPVIKALDELAAQAQEDGEYEEDELMQNLQMRSMLEEEVDRPQRYDVGGKQLWDTMQDLVPKDEYVGYLKLNITKYLVRYRQKNGKTDLLKAQAYLNKLIDTEYGE